jgi:hypothetical protein
MMKQGEGAAAKEEDVTRKLSEEDGGNTCNALVLDESTGRYRAERQERECAVCAALSCCVSL